ncbi:aminopeptidase P N-terminal domain-containing protein, partial [Gemmatimonadota bacterium]
MNRKALCTGLALLSLLFVASETQAQRVEFPPEEFAARRLALCDAVGGQGLIMMFGKTQVPPGVRFRQDNDFYYLTGNEDLNAVLVMDATNCASALFLPAQTAREASRDGWNMLYREGAAERHGFAEIHPLTHLHEYLARIRPRGPQTLFVRLSERTEVDQSRTDVAIYIARRMANPYGSYPSEDAWRVEQLRSR